MAVDPEDLGPDHRHPGGDRATCPACDAEGPDVTFARAGTVSRETIEAEDLELAVAVDNIRTARGGRHV